MKHSFIFLIIIFLSGCSQISNQKLEERMRYWEASLEKNIPKGTSIELIQQWALKNSIEFIENPKTKILYANVEAIEDSGIGFPCSNWNIILKIQLDNNGDLSDSSIDSVGTCL
ncbi:hypothetical protein tinsulaeT_35760 [Thalassotalea insulae]|uniref:Uncharacterized protein n=1 Tax=Thalassotalea insulae TaxID=2056778 RepID=A0ABQ6H034_9GAMM|nr:hypothetical protein [Thalassotalea insulae]GLX80236.1 hypothetical protein tinsulaeT_35760 [Thalassotalea insulae]